MYMGMVYVHFSLRVIRVAVTKKVHNCAHLVYLTLNQDRDCHSQFLVMCGISMDQTVGPFMMHYYTSEHVSLCKT